MNGWVEKSIFLKFQLGEYALFNWQQAGQALEMHFTKQVAMPLSVNQFPGGFSDSCRVFVMRSHPVENKPQQLTVLPEAICYIPALYKRYWTDLSGSFDDYLKNFSGKSRNTLNRKIKKFAEFSGGEIHWNEYTSPDEMELFHRLAREVSAKTYQERLLDCGLPDGIAFIHSMKDLSKKGCLRGYILFHQNNPIAYIYCPIHDGIVLYEYVGHDPDFNRWSPGTVLQYYALSRLFEVDNLKIFDFTEGEGAHKSFFSTHDLLCADVYYFQRTIRNHIMLKIHSFLNTVSESIVRFLDRIGLKAYIKKLLRSAA